MAGLSMTRNDFLDAVAEYTAKVLGELRLPRNTDPDEIGEEDPEAVFKTDGETEVPIAVFKRRLPDMLSSTAPAPYVLHQIVTGTDGLDKDRRPKSTVLLRSVFCIYHPVPFAGAEEDEGAERAMEVVERFRTAILRDGIIANRYKLDLDAGEVETLYYPDDMRPYYIAEIASNWDVPSVKMEYRQYLNV